MEIVELGSVTADTKNSLWCQGTDGPINPKSYPFPI